MAKKLVTSADEALSNLGNKASITEALVKDVAKKIGDKAYIIGEQDAPTDIKVIVPTGSTILDTILTNGKWTPGGWPVRRLIEISGNTSAGKSLLANQALIETQRMGGIPILFDEENSTDITLLVKMGLLVGKEAEKAGVHKLVYISAGTVESVFDTMESTIRKLRELGSKDFVTIVWDSIASTPSKAELEAGYEKEGYGTQKAMAISLGMRKLTQFIGREDILLIFTNQLRQSVGGFGFGDKWVTPGGNAVPFHSSIRVRLTRVSDIKKGDAVIGITVQAQIRKNKIAPPARKCTFDIYFDRGIDDEASWFENLLAKGKISRPTKQSYEFDFSEISSSLGIQKFKKDDWRTFLQDPKVRDWVKKKVIEANVIDYYNLNPGLDDLMEEAGGMMKDEVSEAGEELVDS